MSGKIIHHCQTYLFVFIGCRWCRIGRGRGRRRCVVTTGPRRTTTCSGCRARGGGGKLEITINQFLLVALLLLDNDDSYDKESTVGCSWMFGMTICQRW